MIPFIAVSIVVVFAVICVVIIKNSRFDTLPLLSDEYVLFEDDQPKVLLQNKKGTFGRSTYLPYARIKITTKRIWIGQRFLFGKKISLVALAYFHEYDIPRRNDPWYKRGHAIFLATPNTYRVIADKKSPEICIPVTSKFGAYYNIGEVVIRTAKQAEYQAALDNIDN